MLNSRPAIVVYALSPRWLVFSATPKYRPCSAADAPRVVPAEAVPTMATTVVTAATDTAPAISAARVRLRSRELPWWSVLGIVCLSRFRDGGRGQGLTERRHGGSSPGGCKGGC